MRRSRVVLQLSQPRLQWPLSSLRIQRKFRRIGNNTSSLLESKNLTEIIETTTRDRSRFVVLVHCQVADRPRSHTLTDSGDHANGATR